jgi:hypothetical protein
VHTAPSTIHSAPPQRSPSTADVGVPAPQPFPPPQTTPPSTTTTHHP